MTDIRQTRRSLWLVAQGFINVLASIFGRSEEIAARHTILRGSSANERANPEDNRAVKALSLYRRERVG